MGSRKPRLKVPRLKVAGVGHESRVGRVVSIIGIVCGFAIVFFAYELGQIRAGYNRMEAQERYRELQSKLILAQAEKQRLREQVAQQDTNEKINTEAYGRVESQLAELQATILKQQEDLEFYRGIVSADQQAGLRIQDFELSPGDDEASFRMRLVLAQALRNDKPVSGHVELNVEGMRNGQPVSLGLGDLDAGENGAGRIDFSFRYFQNLGANLVLPEGFAPERVIVKLKPKGKKVKPVEESFAWPVQAG